ncbi:MAG: aminotransferase class V-fold PLP-dependent enzyme [Bacteroidota bacterium]
MLNLPLVRQNFPGLNSDWAFMDNAGGSFVAKPIADRIHEFLLTSPVQHGASYPLSRLAVERVTQGSEAMMRYVNAQHPEEIVMGASTSLLIRILSLCISQQWKIGDEIIVSHSDHEANVSPWMDLEKVGIKVHIWKTNPDSLRFELEELEKLMNERTQLVAITHASNILGTLNPIREYADFIHERGALICVDGVAHAPHRLVDVQALDVDFYIFSFYKVYGPHYALMYGRKDLLLAMDGINHYFITGPDSPYKFQPGNVNFEFAYGMIGLTDYLDSLYEAHFPAENAASERERWQKMFDLMSEHEEALAQPIVDLLNAHSKTRIIGEASADAQVRVPTIAFVHESMDSKAIVDQVDLHKIAIRYGDFYAKKLIHDLDLEAQNGVVRISMVHYNTIEEANRLANVLDRIL